MRNDYDHFLYDFRKDESDRYDSIKIHLSKLRSYLLEMHDKYADFDLDALSLLYRLAEERLSEVDRQRDHLLKMLSNAPRKQHPKEALYMERDCLDTVNYLLLEANHSAEAFEMILEGLSEKLLLKLPPDDSASFQSLLQQYRESVRVFREGNLEAAEIFQSMQKSMECFSPSPGSVFSPSQPYFPKKIDHSDPLETTTLLPQIIPPPSEPHPFDSGETTILGTQPVFSHQKVHCDPLDVTASLPEICLSPPPAPGMSAPVPKKKHSFLDFFLRKPKPIAPPMASYGSVLPPAASSLPSKMPVDIPAAPASTAPAITQVEFSAFCPSSFTRGARSSIRLLMYEKHLREVIEQEMSRLPLPQQEERSGIIEAEKNARVHILLTSPDIEISDPERDGVWAGGILRFNFNVRVPQDYSDPDISFTAHISLNGIPASRLDILCNCHAPMGAVPQIKRKDILTAFMSYSSEDRRQVLLMEHAIKAARSDLDIFMDCIYLRTGENWEERLSREILSRDILFLCWSRSASQSQWVDYEWRTMYRNRGLGGINPMPLMSGRFCPPPKELESLHFDSLELALLQS